jgi:hypothetical protein
MASNPLTPPSPSWSPKFLSRPWTLVQIGLALVVLGLMVGLASTPVKAFFFVAGLIVAGFGVSRRLQTASTTFEERVESAGLIALAAFDVLLAYLGTEKGASTRLFLGVLIGVALAGAVLVLLPWRVRRIVISLWILFHFAGILTAVTSVTTPSGRIPWLPTQLQVRVFHDYLEFTYLINAYHFYSPEPGPPAILWFRVRYNDGTARWIKVPERENYSMGLNFQRMLALTENVAHQGMILNRTQLEERYQLTDRTMSSLTDEGVPQSVLDKLKPLEGNMYVPREVSARHYFVEALRRKLDPQEFEQYQDRLVNAAAVPTWEQLTGEKYPHDPFDDVLKRRQEAYDGTKFYGGMPIPLALVDIMPLLQQYQPPTNLTMLILASYARHVAHSAPHPTNPFAHVKSVRVYRLTHTLIEPRDFAEGVDPRHVAFYLPYYMGEYSPDGKLLDPHDPLLYWLLPIGFTVKPIEHDKPADEPVKINNPRPWPHSHWINCLKIHAGDPDKDPEAKSLESSTP